MGQKVIIRFWWESGLSSASKNHLTTFCRPFVHYACLRLCSAVVHFIGNNCFCFVCYGWAAQVLTVLATLPISSGVQRSSDAQGDCLTGCPLPNSSIEQWSIEVVIATGYTIHCLWCHNMTSYSRLQTNVLAKLTQHAYSGTPEQR